MSCLKFLQQFARRPSKTGAIAASSESLSHLITDTAELENASVVIEFGPGTGVFTEKIRQKISDGTEFFAIECNEHFAELTRSRCPDVVVYHDCATTAGKHLQAHGHSQCDCVICGLPWASFDEELQDRLLDTITEIIKPNGRFLTFAYLQGLLLPAGARFKKKLHSRFSRVETTRTVWRNIPPAFVYCATK